jgi:prolipoprotein diacylglyceryltransferase
MSDRRVFATYLMLVGGTRFLVEFLRVNARVAGPLTVAQLASLAALAVGLWLSLRAQSTTRSSPSINKN